ncbi:MAG TPA: acetate/propionate family kinase [Candidatus Atribacteria bacterium]|nr:acetate/propionate family kinase [Candidatus Atribacteria bacterium]
MKIMALNSGGSSIKYELYEIEKDQEISIGRGAIKRLYRDDSFWEQQIDGKDFRKSIPQCSHEQGFKAIINNIVEFGPLNNLKELKAIGIKCINGGNRVNSTSLIDSQVIGALQELENVTPVHNSPTLLTIDIFQRFLPQVPLVGVFETTFHQSIPSAHYTYGLPFDLCEKLGIFKFGFHGNSHRFISEKIFQITTACNRIISCHLGSGSSICAIQDGKSLDISSGFTPQSGVIMSSRPGDFDPQVITFLQEKEKMSYSAINELLVKKSGFLGISGQSTEIWELEKAAQEGSERALLTIEVFVYQVKKYIGSFIALMNGLDSLVFTGGIGENDSFIREKICHNLDQLGIVIDSQKNLSNDPLPKSIHDNTSQVEVWVIPTNEELMIARETYAYLQI